MSALGWIVRAVTGPFFDLAESLFDKYMNKQISAEQFKAEIAIARANAETQMEAELTKRYTAFQETLRSSPMMQRLLSAVIITQLCVLLFYQLGTPAILFAFGLLWPVPQLQLEWAYTLVAGSLGLKAFLR